MGEIDFDDADRDDFESPPPKKKKRYNDWLGAPIEFRHREVLKVQKAVMRKDLSEGSERHKESTIRKLVKRNVSGGISSHEFPRHLTTAVKDDHLVKIGQRYALLEINDGQASTAPASPAAATSNASRGKGKGKQMLKSKKRTRHRDAAGPRAKNVEGSNPSNGGLFSRI